MGEIGQLLEDREGAIAEEGMVIHSVVDVRNWRADIFGYISNKGCFGLALLQGLYQGLQLTSI